MIKFDSRDITFKSPFGAVEINQEVSFRVLVSRRVCTLDVSIVFEGDNQYVFPLHFNDICGVYEEYTGIIIIDRKDLYFYWFKITTTDGKVLKIGKNNLLNPFNGTDLNPWKMTVYTNSFTGIKSYEGCNIYQIFPDRFCKSGELDASKHSNIKSWGAVPNHIRNADGTLDNSDFFGGNFKGIESKLPYLRSLGIDIIYLNPIFESSSNHRYDTGDYEKTDSMLGTESDFKSLCDSADKFGIRIILDGVFSHTGADSKYFNKFGNYPDIGAYQSQKSNYFSWFKFRSWPDDYECWWNVKILPNTNETDPSYLEYITGKNGIARKWIRCGASGWRLDVADELPDEFISVFREAVKEEKDDSLIIGEVWENASDKISYGKRRKYLHGNQLDSVMNYVFRNAVIDFIRNKSASDFIDKILEICEDYPTPVLHTLMNFLGTHDTERIRTVLGSESLVRIAYAILAFLPGLPTVYYGDEAGMEGGKDPLNRLCYPWGNEDKEMISFISEINRIRHGINCLKEGKFVPLWAEYGLLVFARIDTDEKCVFAVNITDSSKTLPDVFNKGTDLYSNKDYSPGNSINGMDFLIVLNK